MMDDDCAMKLIFDYIYDLFVTPLNVLSKLKYIPKTSLLYVGSSEYIL